MGALEPAGDGRAKTDMGPISQARPVLITLRLPVTPGRLCRHCRRAVGNRR